MQTLDRFRVGSVFAANEQRQGGHRVSIEVGRAQASSPARKVL
jgi:hypothetical protein